MFYTNIYHILFGQIYQKYKRPIDKLRIVRYNKYRNWKTTRMKKYSVVVVQEELAEDMMALIASFSGKLYGLRSKKNKT